MKKLLIYALLFLLPLAACKKEYRYPEDPKKNRKSPNERLKGYWKISEYTFNGVSIRDTLSKIAGEDISQQHYLSYRYDENYYKWSLEIYGKNFGAAYGSYDAFADFHYLYLTNMTGVFNKVYVTPFKSIPNSTVKWTVTKLYGSDFHLKLVTDTGEFRIMYKKL